MRAITQDAEVFDLAVGNGAVMWQLNLKEQVEERRKRSARLSFTFLQHFQWETEERQLSIEWNFTFFIF